MHILSQTFNIIGTFDVLEIAEGNFSQKLIAWPRCLDERSDESFRLLVDNVSDCLVL